MDFTSFSTVEELYGLIEKIDPVSYAKNRNYVSGSVTRLSPYISRGAISTSTVLESVIRRGYTFEQSEMLVKELAWRDYFQRVWQTKDIDADIKNEQSDVKHHQTPKAIIAANTGILAMDQAIKDFYRTGYLHNHLRMYIASVVCNIAGSHWKNPAAWMYYHLLDGDWGSNACSWQWVSGSNSNKKYYANQDNINKYTGVQQKNTFLDVGYEAFPLTHIPDALIETAFFTATTHLPETTLVCPDKNKPTFIYNYYNLDSSWRSGEEGNRVLLLEPDIFKRYPISEPCMAFALKLATLISDIKVFSGSFESLKSDYGLTNFVFREHPLNAHYTGKMDSREWMAEAITGYYPSFFSYWKKAEKSLRKKFELYDDK
jgi:deoxyribodipyrimidine photo-lyase